MDSLKPQVNVIPATPLTEYSTKAQTGAKGVPRDSTFELGPTDEHPEDIGDGGGEGQGSLGLLALQFLPWRRAVFFEVGI